MSEDDKNHQFILGYVLEVKCLIVSVDMAWLEKKGLLTPGKPVITNDQQLICAVYPYEGFVGELMIESNRLRASDWAYSICESLRDKSAHDWSAEDVDIFTRPYFHHQDYLREEAKAYFGEDVKADDSVCKCDIADLMNVGCKCGGK